MRTNQEHLEQSTEKVSLLERARWITAGQLRSIEDLVHKEGGRAILRPDNEDGAYGPTIYAIGEEPLVVMNKVSKRNQRFVGWVFPSEKHAMILQQAGILNFEDSKGEKGEI